MGINVQQAELTSKSLESLKSCEPSQTLKLGGAWPCGAIQSAQAYSLCKFEHVGRAAAATLPQMPTGQQQTPKRWSACASKTARVQTSQASPACHSGQEDSRWAYTGNSRRHRSCRTRVPAGVHHPVICHPQAMPSPGWQDPLPALGTYTAGLPIQQHQNAGLCQVCWVMHS